MEGKEIRKLAIKWNDETAIWMPKSVHKFLKEKAKEEGLPIYKYVLMCAHNYEIGNKDEEYNSKGYKSL